MKQKFIILFLALGTLLFPQTVETKTFSINGQMITREVTFVKHTEYDEYHNVTYTKDSSGNEEWLTYTENSSLLLWNTSQYGINTENRYDDKGNLFYRYVRNYGTPFEIFMEYDERGNQTFFKEIRYNRDQQPVSSSETLTSYDDRNNPVYIKEIFNNSSIVEIICEYDDENHRIYRRTEQDDSVKEETWEYNAYGKVTYQKFSDGTELWTEYDENGNEVLFRNSSGYSKRYEYDDKGNMIYCSDSAGYESFTTYTAFGGWEVTFREAPDAAAPNPEFKTRIWEFDEKGRLIHNKLDESEHFTTYDDKNRTSVKMSIYSSDSIVYEYTEYNEAGYIIHSYKSDSSRDCYDEKFYDDHGKIIMQAGNSSQPDIFYENVYDDKGNLRSVTQYTTHT